ncbi:VOC family protein [Tropicimonas sp.]|uniref:VOC family protein n=1 Tax=Tropicimonas sp. TaxID=2067044 RepID=UPI003A8A5C31
MTGGIHHVTAITRSVQKNVDFYAGFLGLRLVKQTGGFEDAEQLHLFYGDAAGSPGSIVTFLVWEAGSPGRTGLGQVSEIAFAVPPASIGDWLQRALAGHVPVEGPAREFGEPVLRLKDPDGLIVKLVGLDLPAVAPLPDPIAPGRIRSVTILTDSPGLTAGFAARFGYRAGPREGNIRRLLGNTDAVDIRDATGYFPGIPGTGIFDHVAFRAGGADAVRRIRRDLRDAEGITQVHDRKYFLSLYVREPAGTLFEFATDAPGFAVDETPEHLGETLMIPPHDSERGDDLRLMLPQFARPGEDRMPARDLPFVHRFHVPPAPDGSVIVLLHGTGGNEADLMPLAARVNPHATLLGVRGRSTEEGSNRWFRRRGAGAYDQADIRGEAAAFAAFVDGAVRGYGLDRDRLTFLGYSNGANLLGAALQLHPGIVRRAILLRGLQVLDQAPETDLTGTRILLVSGMRDPFGQLAGTLENSLKRRGAALDTRRLDSGHELSGGDSSAARDWLNTA